MRTKKITTSLRLNETIRRALALFASALLAISSCANADSNEKSDELRNLEFVAEYSSCIKAMGLPSEEIKGDVSMLSDHKKRLKKYQKKRKRRIEKMRGLLSKSDFAEDLLAQESSADPASALTKAERKIIREVIRVSNNLWKKELKLYGLLAGWGYVDQDIPNLSLWSCHLIAIRSHIPSNVDMSLSIKDELALVVLTPIGKGVFALGGALSNKRVDKDTIRTYGTDVLRDLRLIVDQCDIGADIATKIELLGEKKHFVDATNFLCDLTVEDDFKLAWQKSQRFYELGLELQSEGVEKVDGKSEYATLHKEIHKSKYGNISKTQDSLTAVATAVANLKLALYQELATACAEVPCGPTYPIVMGAFKELAIAEERKHTRFFFPI